jgi:UDP-N-acetylmuramoyl-tripeptide--D-alanyl-D-alanine ligase
LDERIGGRCDGTHACVADGVRGSAMMSLSDAAAAIGARLDGPDVRFSSVSTDSRTLERGALFVALRGEKFDGHRFIQAARQRGAAAGMVDDRAAPGSPGSGLPFLVVDDTRLALGRLAARWRLRFGIPVVSVAGSNGKTTVKEMIASILRAHYGEAHALATEGNLNNDIGLPLTLLRLRDAHRAAVVELGVNHPGETAYLGSIARPTVALINNAQREHQEFMTSVADVAREHGAVFSALQPEGVAVINADDEFAGYWHGVAAGRRVRDFGIDRPAQVTARYALTGFGSEIELRTPEGNVAIELHVEGRHNVLNALAAAAAATAAGAGIEAAARGLGAFRAFEGRLQRKRGRSGAAVIDDTYNANPDSVRAAIDVLATMPGERVLVLGDMGEVGANGPAFHDEIGTYARGRIDELLTLGALSRSAGRAFGAGSCHFEDIDQLTAVVSAMDAPGRTILVKGSRFMRMERLVAALCGPSAGKGGH